MHRPNVSYSLERCIEQELEVDALHRLPIRITGVTGNISSFVNGVYLYRGIKNGMPYYVNLVNQSYWYCASDGKWTVFDKANFEENKAGGYCASIEPGLGNPSRVSRWQVSVIDKWEEQRTVNVATMVRPSGIKEKETSLWFIIIIILSSGCRLFLINLCIFFFGRNLKIIYRCSSGYGRRFQCDCRGRLQE